jgi:periplasmic protein TonB
MSTEAHSPDMEVGMKVSKLALRCALAFSICAAAVTGVAAQGLSAQPGVAAASSDEAFWKSYRPIGAQHLYGTYKQRIYKGKLPPLLYAIAITETEIDENGNVVSAVVTREPAAAKEVGPLVVAMIHAASPFPKPGRAGRTRYQDVWLVDQSYKFQLDTLTEGQL